MVTPTVENYLKRLYMEQQRAPGRLVSTGRLAAALGVTPGTVTTMMKALADAGLAEYETRRGAKLSARGARLALHVVRRHRLIELFLVKVLGMDWSEVHDEAERLEHAVSDQVLTRIDQLLGHPETDPHGDAIPTATGRVPRRTLHNLADCEPGTHVRIAQMGDQDPAFLRFADDHGLVPGCRVVLEQRDPAADSVTVRPEGRLAVVVGTSAARRIFVSQG